MWLTKNEKKVLKLLLDDAKLSDTAIAQKLKISSQAIGRIRKKLEETIIKGYTLDIDYSKLGLDLFVLGRAYIDDSEYKKEEIEDEMIASPDCIGLFRTFHEKPSHLFMGLFKDLNSIKHNCIIVQDKNKANKYIKIQELIQIPTRNILKMCSKNVLHKAIDNIGLKSNKIKFLK